MEFLTNWGAEIALSVLTAAALGLCKYFHSKLKKYKKIVDDYEESKLEELVDSRIKPLRQELEDLKVIIQNLISHQDHDIQVIVDSYKFRLIQLCQMYQNQGHMSADEYNQLSELYKAYSGLGGNGQAKAYFDRTC